MLSGQVRQGRAHTRAHNRPASIGRCDVTRFSETAEKRVEKNEETILLAITENRPCGSFSRAAISLFSIPFLRGKKYIPWRARD